VYCSFWMDGLYLQSMQDPNNHLFNPRTTWVQDMETRQILITAGSEPCVKGNKFIVIKPAWTQVRIMNSWHYCGFSSTAWKYKHFGDQLTVIRTMWISTVPCWDFLVQHYICYPWTSSSKACTPWTEVKSVWKFCSRALWICS
jgi:hypothetical protein